MKDEATYPVFLDLFQDLREQAGISLDMEQYFAFQDLFLQGYGDDKDSLLFLCKSLWLTHQKYETVFEELFEKAWSKLNESWKRLEKIEQAIAKQENENQPNKEEGGKDEEIDGEMDPFNPDNSGIEEEGSNQAPTQQEKQESEPEEEKDENLNQLKDIRLSFEEGEGKGSNKRKDKMPEAKYSEKRFSYSSFKHQPISQRRLQKLLQKLRIRQVQTGTDTPDIPLAIEKMIKERVVIEIPYKTVQSRKQEIILLSDHLGAMLAFEAWGDSLYQALASDPGTTKISRYYFNKYPATFSTSGNEEQLLFFKNQAHTQGESLKDILSTADRKATWVIIFSDAGMYEKQLSYRRLELWDTFKDMAKKQVKNITWINPFPKDRWANRSAAYLSILFPMIPLDIKSLEDTINQVNHET